MKRRRNNPKQLTKHHRKPKSLGGKNSENNISLITREKHEAWHLLFDNHPPENIADIINGIYLDPSYRFICIKADKIYEILNFGLDKNKP